MSEMTALRGQGHLVIIGGNEDREGDMTILKRFVELAGGDRATIAVITAASQVPGKMWADYDAAFGALGVAERRHIPIETRDDANDPALVDYLARASGIFMSGGDQGRLLALLGGTATDAALHAAYRERGACIGGTSAGASAMSGHMLAEADEGVQPAKGMVSLGAGFGLVQRVVIDQHFSQRKRLGRLLSVVAENPFLQGIGIDEDTALVIARGAGIEVAGAGTVTILDAQHLHTDIADIDRHQSPELIDMRLHVLPSGARYRVGRDAGIELAPAPIAGLVEALSALN